MNNKCISYLPKVWFLHTELISYLRDKMSSLWNIVRRISLHLNQTEKNREKKIIKSLIKIKINQI